MAKNENVHKRYFAEMDRQEQLSMLKDYMLSLNLEELKAFMLEPMHFLGNALKDKKVGMEEKSQILDQLKEMEFLLKGKVVSA
jgi:hypothetical protein